MSLRVRRFLCAKGSCPRKTFAEQVPGLTRRFARRTERLRSTLVSVDLALAGRAGARMADAFGVSLSRNTLLRLITSLPDPPTATSRVLNPVLEVAGIRFGVPPPGHLAGCIVLRTAEVVGACLDLRCHHDQAVEAPFVPYLEEEIDAQVVLGVLHRSQPRSSKSAITRCAPAEPEPSCGLLRIPKAVVPFCPTVCR